MIHGAALMLAIQAQVLDWGIETSLTHVRAAQATAEGLWCATSGGVFFYSFENGFTTWYGYPDELPHFIVNDILEDTSGRLWCATGDGLAKLEDGQWQFFTEFEGVPGTVVGDVEQAGQWIWVATDGGIARWTGEDFLPMDELITQGGFTADQASALEVFRDTLWIATSEGVFSLDLQASPFSGESWEDWSDLTQTFGMTGLYAGADSLYGFGADGVFRRDQNRWNILLDYSAYTDSSVQALLETPDGLLAAAFKIRRHTGGTSWERYGGGFPGDRYASFLAWGDGTVWAGAGSLYWADKDYGRGLCRLTDGAWQLVPIPGLPGSNCYQYVEHGGNVYMGSHGRGLMAGYGGLWREFEQDDGYPNTLRTYSVAPSGTGSVWAAAYHYGLTWVRDGGTLSGEDDSLVTFVSDSIAYPPPQTHQVVAPLLNNQVVCLARDGDWLWIAQEAFWQTPDEPSGLVVCSAVPGPSMQWAGFTEADGLAAKNLRAVMADGSGGVWIAFSGDAGCQYLSYGGTPLQHSDDHWLPGPNEAWTAAAGLPSNQVYCFASDGDGVLVGTGSGLARWTESGGFDVVGGVSGAIKAIAVDGLGRAWCLGSSAVWLVDGGEVLSFGATNSPFRPSSRVESEFGAWLPGSGDVVFSSIDGLWRLHVGGGSQASGGAVFHPQPFIPGAGEPLGLTVPGEGPVTVKFFSIEGTFLGIVEADSPDEWEWDGDTGSDLISSGVYMTLVECGGTVYPARLAVVR